MAGLAPEIEFLLPKAEGFVVDAVLGEVAPESVLCGCVTAEEPAAVGATAGGVAGGLIGMDMPEYEAKRYEGKIKDGNVLMSVRTQDSKERDRAKEIFKNGGADDISSTGEEGVPKENQANERPLRA